MASAFVGLNTVVRGLMAQQIALNTVGHNISNANTDGYSRQSVNLASALPEYITGSHGLMQLGTGVEMQSITRARDTFMDLQMWKENSTLGYAQTQQDLMNQVEQVLSISSESGLQSVLDNFWSAWQSLGTNASDDSTRNLVVQRGVELANSVDQAVTQLKGMVTNINADLQMKVDTVNQITSDILSLNRMISMGEISSGSGSANDLRDQRDLLVDKLSAFLKIQVSEDSSGNYVIQSGAVNLVNGYATTPLETYSMQDSDYGYEVLGIQAKGIPVNLTTGELKGLVDMRDSTEFGIKNYLDQLATVSKFLLRDFNAIHRQGYGEDNVSGRNFFGTGSTAYDDAQYLDPFNANYMTQQDWLSALKVNPAFFDQTTTPPGLQMIAAKTSAAQGNASGDNAVKLAQAMKMNVNGASLLGPTYNSTLGSTASLDSFFSGVIGALGIQSQSTARLVENQKSLVAQVENWRQSTAGVNMDEEMANMIRFQKGYNAAARMITTMDEMFDKLINNTGIVGR